MRCPVPLVLYSYMVHYYDPAAINSSIYPGYTSFLCLSLGYFLRCRLLSSSSSGGLIAISYEGGFSLFFISL
jgi:hypothetical protein